MSRTSKNTSLYFWVLNLGTQLMFIIVFFTQLNADELLTFCYNTDYLYLPSLFQDVVIEGGDIQSWYLTPSPYFFPDMLLYFIIYPLVGNIGMAGLIYAFIQLVIIQFLLAGIIRCFKLNESSHVILLGSVQLVTTFILFFPLITHWGYIAHLVLSHSAHMGTLVNMLFGILLFIRMLESKKGIYHVMFFIATIVFIISDKLIVPHLIIPLILVSFFYLIKKRSFMPFLIVIVSLFVGLLLFGILGNYLIIPSLGSSPVTALQSIKNMGLILKSIFQSSPLSGIFLLFAGLLSLFHMYITFRFRDFNQKMIWTILVLSLIFSFWSPVLYGYIQSKDTLRYVIHSILIAIMLLPLGLYFGGMSNAFKKPGVLVFMVGSMFITSLLYLFNASSITNYLHFKSSYVDLVDKYHHHLKSGVAHYWRTKQPYLLGSNKTRLVSIYPKTNVAHIWEANRNWYLGPVDQPTVVFNFSLNEDLSLFLGEPLGIYTLGNDSLFIYNDFKFTETKDKEIILTPI